MLKSPQHLEQHRPAADHVPRRHRSWSPTATRWPSCSRRSRCSPTGPAPRTARPRPEWYRDYWTDRIGRLLDASLRDRHLLPEDRTVDVFFHEYMADEIGTLAARLRRRRHRAHRPRPGPRSRPTSAPTPAARRAGWSTTCAATSPSPPRRSAPGSARTSTASPRTDRGPVNIQEQVDHLIDTRPGPGAADARSTTTPPTRSSTGFVYRSGGTTAAYLVLTDTGRVIVNTGMGFEAPHHKRVFDAIRPGPTHHDRHHPGPRRPRRWRRPVQGAGHHLHRPGEQPGLPGRRQAHPGAADAHRGHLVRHARHRRHAHLPSRTRACRCASRSRRPTSSSTTVWRSTVDGLRIELLAAVGETIDCCVVWLPEHRIALVSNLFGPLFPHFPNVNTIRGDRYRFVEPQLATNRMVRELRPEVLVTGRHEPIVGADLIEASLERLHDAVDHVHRPGARGLQRRHRRVDADARDRAAARAAGRAGLRQGLVGGAHVLGGVRRLVQAAVDHRALPRPRPGRAGRAGRRRRHRRHPRPGRGGARRGATRWSPSVSARPSRRSPPTILGSPALMAGAHRHLLDHGGDVSFWEDGWLRTQAERWEAG